MAVIALGSMWTQGTAVGPRVVGTVLTLVVSASFSVFQFRLVSGYHDRQQPLLAVSIVILPIINVGLSSSWAMLGVAAATIMISPRFGWLAAPITVAAGVGAAILGHASATLDVAIPVISLVVAVGLHTLTRLAQALNEVRLSREQLTRLQVDRERDRISRDLHDIVGRTMVATSLRLQSAIHLVDRDIGRTKEQLEHAQKALTDGQAELRALTRGPITTSLTDELQAASALCDRLAIDLHIDVPIDALEDPQTTAARIVREAITNMLKHSRPKRCTIRIRTAPALDVTITNDGCPPDPVAEVGTGLVELRRLLEPAGLILTATKDGWDGFRLYAGPLTDPTTRRMRHGHSDRHR